MKTIIELKSLQDALDSEITTCRKCGKEEDWGFIREWGDCNECVAKQWQEQDIMRNKKVLPYMPGMKLE